MKDAENTAQDCGQVTGGERITVALVPKAAGGFRSLQERTSMSKTDIVNRGIILYDFIDAQIAAGASVLLRSPDGTTAEVRFL